MICGLPSTPYFECMLFIGRPAQLMVYPPRHYCVSTFNFFKYLFIGRPWFMVYLPCPICNHDFFNVCYLLVDHNLWSTLHAIIVAPRFF